MRTPTAFFSAILFSCVSLALIGCGYDLVEAKELEKLKAAEAEVSRLKEENSQLKQQVATLKSIGRYQLHQSGFRTWRLDTSTGQDCLLLSSTEDWKKADTVLESCPSQ
jgi:outer membrane lipopolysaccharide assembly protein LptE/RlpB